MERYTDSKKIQMYCTTTLYYLVRCHLTQVAMNIRVKQKIISTLLNVMYAHRHDTTIVRNGCLTICQFQLPHDVVLINYKLYLQNSKHERSCYLGRKKIGFPQDFKPTNVIKFTQIYNLSTFSAAACLEKNYLYQFNPHFLQRFEYEKLVKILLYIVSEHGSDEGGSFVQRAGICLLNSLAVQVDGPQKLLVGNLGAMEKMLEVIRTKLNLGNTNIFSQIFTRNDFFLII